MEKVNTFEYKQKWKPGYVVRLHSDLESAGKDWCKIQLHRQQWDMTKWTNVYEHTFYFEYKQDAKLFKERFKEYADQL